MKKSKIWLILAFIIIIGIGIGIYFLSKNKNSNNSNYSASRTSINEEQSNNINYSNTNNSISNNRENTTNISDNITNNSIENRSENSGNPNNSSKPSSSSSKKEEAIVSFSTKIYSKDSERQNNISITCSTLNNTIVKKDSTFSFCNTLGPSTSAKGYQKADIFDNDGNKKKGLGGGNCQVSTTLYNAVLKVPSLQVTERHEHSNKVPYIQQGKDAAVAYGSYDLKFKNNTGFDIKIAASCTKNNVSITIYKIVPNK